MKTESITRKNISTKIFFESADRYKRGRPFVSAFYLYASCVSAGHAPELSHPLKSAMTLIFPGPVSMAGKSPKTIGVVSALSAWLTVFGACSNTPMQSLLPYEPVITFAAIVGSDSLFLPGSRQHPNTCAFDADTMRMYFFSDNFQQGSISTGDQLRIDVFFADSQFITERRARLHFTRYDHNQTTCTYEIIPADTLNDYNNLTMKVMKFEWKNGGSVHFTDITATARPLGQFGAAYLSISHGVISGNIRS